MHALGQRLIRLALFSIGVKDLAVLSAFDPATIPLRLLHFPSSPKISQPIFKKRPCIGILALLQLFRRMIWATYKSKQLMMMGWMHPKLKIALAQTLELCSTAWLMAFRNPNHIRWSIGLRKYGIPDLSFSTLMSVLQSPNFLKQAIRSLHLWNTASF